MLTIPEANQMSKVLQPRSPSTSSYRSWHGSGKFEDGDCKVDRFQSTQFGVDPTGHTFSRPPSFVLFSHQVCLHIERNRIMFSIYDTEWYKALKLQIPWGFYPCKSLNAIFQKCTLESHNLNHWPKKWMSSLDENVHYFHQLKHIQSMFTDVKCKQVSRMQTTHSCTIQIYHFLH